MTDPKAQPRKTQQRDAIRQVIHDAGRPLTPAEILEFAGEKLPNLGQSTVYRTIKLLLAEDELALVEVPGQPPRYETAEAAETHHHHFLCNNCGRAFDIHGCPGQLSQMLPQGFTLDEHDILLKGFCQECNAAK